ncbi:MULTISPECIES: replication initiation protein [unclassified Nitratiruptor]|uniref:replication initiation protein n=1 Tax=unclassified Nitratiruptor TaxID=2624044 RepID=UPI0018ED7655|nr:MULTISPECIES: replication initiation protein [unclassified Nitratiruptor]BCD61166.1 hypothetical protein NitYY0810_P30 [Nitratiruptor sp. YY08-10]BCD65099.1 hypothetical protein NitYY0814_P30 [Nitratiruptor sp. YY08-14]
MKEKLKKYPIVKKHNSLTDGYIKKTDKEVLPDKMINVLYHFYEIKGEKFTLKLPELRAYLGLDRNGRNDDRIYKVLQKLKENVLFLRDFNYKGREVKMAIVSFLNEATIYKDKENEIEIEISSKMIEFLKQKTGYTPIELEYNKRFKTKFGLKLYEMYKRYYDLPNKEGFGYGKVEKTLEQINAMFGTNYKHTADIFNKKYPHESKTAKGINRGIEEIKNITGIYIHCFYDKEKKKFVFGWDNSNIYPNEECVIPKKSIKKFANWYVLNRVKSDKENLPTYVKEIEKKIKNNTLNGIHKFYMEFLKAMGKDKEEIANCWNKYIKKWKC